MPAPEDSGLLAPVWAGTPVHEATSDRAWLQAMLDTEAALARAQAHLGLIPADAAGVITAAADAEAFDIAAIAVRSRASGNPVIALVAELRSAVGPAAAEHVHRGSTSQDIVDTATMLVASRSLPTILGDLGRTAAALAGHAETHRDTVMAGRTLTQHAVPITFGLKAAGWLDGLTDADAALRRLADEGFPVQVGGAAGTLAGYRLGADSAADVAGRLPALVARELALRAPGLPWHTNRYPVAALGAALALTAGALGKFAVDVQVLSRTEIAEVAEAGGGDRGGSSAMPHKRNPVLATLIRSAALQMPHLAATLATSMLAEDERPAGPWQAEWPPLRDCLRLTGGAARTAAELAEGLTVFPDRMRANLDLTGGLVASERLSVALAPFLGRARAAEVISNASAEAARTGRPLSEVLAGSDLPGDLPLAELTDPTAYTGAAGVLVDRALRRHRTARPAPPVASGEGAGPVERP